MHTKKVLALFFFIFLSAQAFSFSMVDEYYGEDFVYILLSGDEDKIEGALYEKTGAKAHCGENNCYTHRSIRYSDARKEVYLNVDAQKDGKGFFVEDVYCQHRVDLGRSKHNLRMPNHTNYNIEHTWPQSRFKKVVKNPGVAKADMHHLYPTQNKANGIRGSYKFGNAGVALSEKLCSASKLGVSGRSFVFEPPMKQKGNVARALFYFSLRYGLKISQNEEKVLRLWHELDPVDAQERLRNDKIFMIQQNRNPFIDFPQAVDLISNF